MNSRLFIHDDMMLQLLWDRFGVREAHHALNAHPWPFNIIMATATACSGAATARLALLNDEVRAAWYPLLIPLPPRPERQGQVVTVNYGGKD